MGKASHKITARDLELCLPIFQSGSEAEKELLAKENVQPEDLIHLETLVEAKRLVLAHLVELARPLIMSEVSKLLKTSILQNAHEEFSRLYYSGVKGFERGLEKFTLDRLQVSATNYLMQWVYTFAKRELMSLEAPFGIAPTRYEKLKKIAAVRRRLSEELGRAATNQELLEFFHSGEADMRNKRGKVANAGKPSKENQKITLAILEEQQEVEEKLKILLLDPKDDYLTDVRFAISDPSLFEETLFGTFVSQYDFDDDAIAVLKSELQVEGADSFEILVSPSAMTKTIYNSYVKLWTQLFQDPSNIFLKFLKKVNYEDFEDSDIPTMIKTIESRGRSFSQEHYSRLFIG